MKILGTLGLAAALSLAAGAAAAQGAVSSTVASTPVKGCPGGTFAPTIATSGFVGDFDVQCQQDGTCLGPQFNGRPYFSQPVDSVEFLAFSATFEAGACGVWRQSLSGNTGDIVC